MSLYSALCFLVPGLQKGLTHRALGCKGPKGFLLSSVVFEDPEAPSGQPHTPVAGVPKPEHLRTPTCDTCEGAIFGGVEARSCRVARRRRSLCTFGDGGACVASWAFNQVTI